MAKVVVTVPDLPGKELIALFERRFNKRMFHHNDRALFAGWDFIESERGKVYEVFPWSYKHHVSNAVIRKAMEMHGGYDGNVAAFLMWLSETKPIGLYTTVPNDLRRLFRSTEESVLAPAYIRDAGSHYLGFRGVDAGLAARWCAMGFREVRR